MVKKTVYDSSYVTLIHTLREERKRLGLSQVEVATQMKLIQSDISKIENLDRRIDALELKKILEIYRVKENKKLRDFIIQYLSLFGANINQE